MESVVWKAEKDTNHRHTALTKYVTEGYVIWKGKRNIYSTIYSADKWHLIRLSDGKELWYGKTAKECKENFEYALKLER